MLERSNVHPFLTTHMSQVFIGCCQKYLDYRMKKFRFPGRYINLMLFIVLAVSLYQQTRSFTMILGKSGNERPSLKKKILGGHLCGWYHTPRDRPILDLSVADDDMRLCPSTEYIGSGKSLRSFAPKHPYM